jgi:hypothetical protein
MFPLNPSVVSFTVVESVRIAEVDVVEPVEKYGNPE